MKSLLQRPFRLLLCFYRCCLQKIIKHCLLPATLFRKRQVKEIHQNFEKFWLKATTAHKAYPPKRFSTVTLGRPIDLWAYYFPTQQEREQLHKHYTENPFHVIAEDGSLLQGSFFRFAKPTPETRTLIVFGGNGDLYKIGSSAWLLKLLQKAPCGFHVVMFDPRECGYSEGRAHAEGLVSDGETLYRYVQEQLGVDEDCIDLCGFSLGAAIATLVKANHPHTQGVLISNRSFSSLDNAVKAFFSPLTPAIAQAMGSMASHMTTLSGWNLNPLHAWDSITSPKMVIYHKEDPVIRYEASLAKSLSASELLEKCHAIHLIQKNPHMAIANHHVQPLSFYNDHLGHDVETKIL
ncbi:MAG: alpha/beta hydrolase, partial [Chlamydiae bacterium]|nr:alpha/beta hydrolase [Chlamydiota bacterium]